MVEIYKNKIANDNSVIHQSTLVISFYKNINMLKLVLASLEIQTYKNFSVIICDDGSPEAILHQVKQLIDLLPMPCTHLWHADSGFRKNRILNWAVHYCQTEQMIFIDQDCILHPEFIREHNHSKKENTVLCGRRINLTDFVSRILSVEKIKDYFLQNNIWWIMLVGCLAKDNNGIKGLYFKNLWLRRFANKKPRGIVGCNFSVDKKELLKINGFDTRYEGPGFGEDSDIEHRLSLNGVRMQPACNTVVQYHIFHKLLTRSNENESLFAGVVKQGQATTSFGILQQLEIN